MTESDPYQLEIDEIWAMDAVNHGDSALLNKSNLGDIFEWSDHARDILNFVANFLPESMDACNDPSLPQVSEQVSQQRRDHGFKSRIVVGLGHSLGGCTLVRAVIESPNLFSSVILVDPVIYPSYSLRSLEIDGYIKGALARREHWPDRETARAALLNLPFFQAWNPDVLADYVTYGMYEFEGEVKLKCPGYQEAATFSENGRLPCEVWELLPSLDERVPLKWIMDSNNASTSSKFDETTPQTVWRRPANSSNIRIQEAGHLIPQETPRALAHEILDFIRLEHGNRAIGSTKSKL